MFLFCEVRYTWSTKNGLKREKMLIISVMEAIMNYEL